MNRGIQSVAGSMANSEQYLDVTANNLANANTAGFKRDGLSFQATLQQVATNGGLGNSVGSLSTGTVLANPYTTLGEQGPITATGNPLDVALKSPNAMFAVQNADNTVSYTRDGSFSLNSSHELVTQSGALVLDSNKSPITLPSGQISIAANGTISVTNGKTTTPAGTLGVFTGSFSKAGANLYTGSNITDVATPDLAAGSVEGSNVNAVESMLDLIRISRSYEMQQKSITQQDELSQKLLTTIG